MAFSDRARNSLDRFGRYWLGYGCDFSTSVSSAALSCAIISLTSPLLGDRTFGTVVAGVVISSAILIAPSKSDWLIALLGALWISIFGSTTRYDWCGLTAGLLSTNSPSLVTGAAVIVVAVTTTTSSDMDAMVAISFTVASLMALAVIVAILVRPKQRLTNTVVKKSAGQDWDSPETERDVAMLM